MKCEMIGCEKEAVATVKIQEQNAFGECSPGFAHANCKKHVRQAAKMQGKGYQVTIRYGNPEDF